MVDCPFLTPEKTCRHVDEAVGRPIPMHEEACAYCIAQHPDPQDRVRSRPVAVSITRERIKDEANIAGRPPCFHLGAFIRSNEDPEKRHCGSCAYHECKADQGDDGVVRQDVHCIACECYTPRPAAAPAVSAANAPSGIRLATVPVTATEDDADHATIRYDVGAAAVNRVNDVWVAGYPSPVGGADTELWHQIKLWRSKGVGVNLVPIGGQHPGMRAEMNVRGCVTHNYRPDVFGGKIVVSFCNGEFLKQLPAIVHAGRPLRTVWINCMCWATPNETAAHKAGWIDVHLFQSEYQRRELKPKLEAERPVSELPYSPYFDQSSFAIEAKPTDYFGVGRISRNDPAKFHPRTWSVFGAVRSPRTLKAFILGHDDKITAKIGQPPDGLDYMLWPAGGVEAAEFYRRVHCILHATDSSKENLPRVLLEAWATGTVFVAENNYGFPELIEDGVNGFLCRSPEHMAATATMVANDEELRRKVAAGGLRSLERFSAERSWKTWERVLFGAMSTPQTRRQPETQFSPAIV